MPSRIVTERLSRMVWESWRAEQLRIIKSFELFGGKSSCSLFYYSDSRPEV